jgi:hypothetical protein
MSQPTQCFNTNLPDGSYSVIDNGAAWAVSTNVNAIFCRFWRSPTRRRRGEYDRLRQHSAFVLINGATTQNANTVRQWQYPR